METARYTEDGLDALPVGATIGGFAIRRLIGAGGFGITYEAHNRVTGKGVAIKEFFPSSMVRRDGASRLTYSKANEKTIAWALRKFEETTTTLCGLEHPNIVRVHDYVPANDTGYMIMELLDGQTLKEWLEARGQPPRLDELRPLVDPVMEALSYVHGQGLIHRDIAPDNILITREGRPVLIDFGSVSRDLSDARQKAMSGTVGLAKRHYTAPEQMLAKSRPTPEADVYSMGAVLYRALTGVPPADGQDRVNAIFHEKAADPYAALLKRMPAGCTARAAQAIDAALAVSPEQRLRKVADLHAALAPAAGTPGAPKPPTRWLSAAAAAVVVAALGGLFVGTRWSSSGNRAGEATLDGQRNALDVSRADLAKQREDLKIAKGEADRRGAAIDAAQADVAKQRDRLGALATETARATAEVEAAKAEIDRQRQSAAQTKADLDKQQQMLAGAQTDLVRQRDELAEDKSRLHQERTQLDQERTQLGRGTTVEADRLSRQLRDARASAEDGERRRAAAEADAEQQRNLARGAVADADRLREQVREKDDAMAALTAELARVQRSAARPVSPPGGSGDDRPPPAAALYSYTVNTGEDGWAALRVEPDARSRRLAKVYDGTLFQVVGEASNWKRVRLLSGETGWIINRLIGCCRSSP